MDEWDVWACSGAMGGGGGGGGVIRARYSGTKAARLVCFRSIGRCFRGGIWDLDWDSYGVTPFHRQRVRASNGFSLLQLLPPPVPTRDIPSVLLSV